MTDIDIHGNRSTNIWSAVWKADTIPKVKNFMWKLLSNSLAVMKNLRHQWMNVLTNCPVCGLEEDIEYMIHKCKWVEAIWFVCLGVGAPKHTRQTIGEWIEDRRDEPHNSRDTKETRWNLCRLTCWHICIARHKEAFESKMPNLTVVVDEIKQSHEKYVRASNEIVSTSSPGVAQVWRTPEPHSVKVNCDASWCRQTKMCGISVIAKYVGANRKKTG